MSITFDGTALNWYTHTIVKDGTTVSSPTAVGEVYFGSTKVWGTGGSYSNLFSFTLKPDSSALETAVSTMQSSYSAAFKNAYYDIGPGSDSRYQIQLRKGYRMSTSDGNFVGDDSTYFYLWEGESVTGANTSHNGDTSCTLQRDNGV
jgi:hypothetical protein